MPLLLLQAMFGGGLVIVIPLIAGRLTNPLRQLAAAADCIAGGDLAQPIQVTGEDEVGRMGEAFEDMRVRLKSRMEDLALLLEISQMISATLELSQGIPFILNGALQTSGAQVARMVLLSADGAPQMVMSSTGAGRGLGALDRALVSAVRKRGQPVILENMARVRSLVDLGMISEQIGAVIALPVRAKERISAVMWMGYQQPRRFDDLEIDFLSTLVSSMAMLVDNARLFEAAEGGRRRLAAILDSITDAVLVTDRRDRVLLVNPAAEQTFDVIADVITGQEIEQAQLPSALVGAFQDLASFDQVVAREIPLPDGRTLYANVSTILGADGHHIGHVAVMRDVTRFKELDELKSEFLSTVSHDLRAPLMFMRGYAKMLPAVGELSDKQRDYVEKILYGVEQIDELVSDLLDLGRIETGLGLERSPCHLEGVVIEAVDGMRARAATKEITLRTEPSGSRAVVSGDAALLRRAVTNLVDNAIKYTPNNGIVTVGLAVRQDGAGEERAVIRVTDTGVGIAPDDQARLFEKFYRIKRRGAPNISGTGLGLAIVKSVVERHEGKVWIDSQLHEGSTFYISLPLYEDDRTTGRMGE
jgi:PAS domain S-box-containing protein